MILVRSFLTGLARVHLLLALTFFATASSHAAEPTLADSLEENLRQPFLGDLDTLIERGFIRVLIPFSKTGYFIDKGVQRGTSVDLMREFGKYLDKTQGEKMRDVELVMIPTQRDRLFTDLEESRGDIAVGNLTITTGRQKLADFSHPLLQDVHEVPVTADTVATLTSPMELSGLTVHVRKSASYYQSLEALNRRLAREGKKPAKLVFVNERLEDEDLLEMVSAGGISTVIVDQHKAELWLEVLDGLKIHPEAAVRTDGEIAIAVRQKTPDLLQQINGFAETAKKGTLLGNILLKKYLREADYLRNMRKESYEQSLDEYRALFQKYGSEYKFDWLLIAAQSYQESKFDAKARSRAGAVGLMQIKPSTAEASPIDIKGIARDPDKNVHAGVKYLRYLADQYFPGLAAEEADQTFFALAAYNAGPSRFAKLRDRAKQQGYDPDIWFGNVEWIVAAEIGREPVNYVGNIYQYYVVFHNEHKRLKADAAASEAAAQK